MLRLTLSVADLGGLRFAFSPLWEVVASVRVLKEPGAHPLHLAWVRRARADLRSAGVEWDLLSALVPVPTRTLPGFLAPTPSAALPELGDELGAMVAVPAEELRQELRKTFGPTLRGTLAELHADPAAGLPRLAGQVRAYWDVALAADWARVRGLLEGDVMYRGRRLTHGGADLLFADLDPSIGWADGAVTVTHPTVTAEHTLDGRGLVLVPSAFVWPRVFVKVDPRWPPVIRYPARGVATVWDRGGTVDGGLAGVLGRSRARLLVDLEAPASTTELARRTGLSPAAVSHHLSRLRAAGLVTAHRAGSVVLYARTATADALLRPR